MSDAAKWVATLSDGSTAVEDSPSYSVIPGKRRPWVRLVEHLANDDLSLTSLRLNINGRTVHLPRKNFDRFNLNAVSRAPLFYSLSYLHEAEMDGEGILETEYVDLTAHYDSFEVHYVQDITDGNTSWVTVTEGFMPMAPSPRN